MSGLPESLLEIEPSGPKQSDLLTNTRTRLSSYLQFVLFWFLGELNGMWDLSSLTRVRTHAPCSGSSTSTSTREVQLFALCSLRSSVVKESA